MSMPFGADDDIGKLKNFFDYVIANPAILQMPQLKFVRDFIENFGGKIPVTGDFKMPEGGKCPFGGDAKPEAKVFEPEEEEMSEPEVDEMESEESDLDLDMEGVIAGDEPFDQPMGNADKEPTDDEIDQASELRSQAAAAYSEQKYQDAIDLYTKAIEMNPGNALYHAKRGQAFLKLKKPNACIRDCDKALELNCDSAASYKFRGRAHRLIGNWAEAAKDLRQACKLDFDEESNEWLLEVTPNAKKIEQHRIKMERKKIEHQRQQQEQAKRRAQAHAKKQYASAGGGKSGGPGAGAGGFPSGFPGAGGFKFPGAGAGAGGGGGGGGGGAAGVDMADILSACQDPEVLAAFEEILKNPENVEKYKSNPKISKLMDLAKGMKGGIPGFPSFPGAGGVPGSGPGADGMPTPPGGDEPTSEPPKSKANKPDFTDDGLD